jgi:putative SOS response-associated peptidase YedK
MLCARRDAGDPRLHPARLRWGLVPSWSKEDSGAAKMINARAESVFKRPAFRAAAKSRRCVAIVDGFYEWHRPEKGPKTPYLFRVKGGRPFAIAALWEAWRAGYGEPWLETCSLLTTDANEMTRPVHDRMPVILAPEGVRLWTDLAVREADALAPLLRPFDSDAMESWVVSTRVNNPRNDDARLLERAEASGGGGSLF